MENLKSYDRQPGEPTPQWMGFLSYRDLGPNRIILDGYRAYKKKRHEAAGRAESQYKEPQSVSGSYFKWKEEYKWDDRCRDYDRDQEAIERQIKLEKDAEALVEGLTEFRDTQMKLGKSAAAIALRGQQMIIKYFATNPEITSTAEAERVARLCGSMKDSAALWAQALSIEKLLEEIDA